MLKPFCLPIVMLAFAISAALSPSAVAGPDDFTPAVEIGSTGAMPAVAVGGDGQIHLIYVRGGELLYRKGSASLRFEPEEKVFKVAGNLHDPHIALDKNGDPHVAVSDGHAGNPNTFYANRIGGKWTPALAVWNKTAMKTNRSTMPSIAVDDDLTAFVGVFTVGHNKDAVEWGGLVRIENGADGPRIAKSAYCHPWVPQVLLVKGKLWVAGRVQKNVQIQEYDKVTLAPKGRLINMSKVRVGEVARAMVDHTGEVHVAGAGLSEKSPTVGWYSTLKRAAAGDAPLSYRSSKFNPCGSGTAVRDRKAEDRVYVFYWSTDAAVPDEENTAAPLRFARFEKGKLEANNAPLEANRSATHGRSYRTTPCAAALPTGGAIVVREAGSNRLVVQTVGAKTP